MNDQIIEKLLWRYFEGRASKKEADSIMYWLDQSEANRQLFVSSKKIFLEIEANSLSHNEIAEKGYNRFFDTISKIELEEQSDKKSQVNRFQKLFWRYAAILIIVFGLSAIAYFLGVQTAPIDNKTFCEIEVPYGGKSMLILPDGSKIWLNAGSKLKYNRDFDLKSREVYLEGEAFFEVEKRKHPLVVHTSHIDIHVLGTTFNVKSYPDEDNIEATLVEGNIRIDSKVSDRPLFLKPNEKLTFHKSDMQISVTESEEKNQVKSAEESIASQKASVTQLLKVVDIVEDVNTDESTSWKDGKLIINNESLEELTRKLERKYDVTFTFDSEQLKEYSYSGTLRDFPLEQVLTALELTSPIRYVIKEKSVILYYNRNFKPVKNSRF
jgi:transmembrane sensor